MFYQCECIGVLAMNVEYRLDTDMGMVVVSKEEFEDARMRFCGEYGSDWMEEASVVFETVLFPVRWCEERFIDGEVEVVVGSRVSDKGKKDQDLLKEMRNKLDVLNSLITRPSMEALKLLDSLRR